MQNYKCSVCGTTGKKLWRTAQSFRIDLVCYNCSGETKFIDEEGKIEGLCPEYRTDQIFGSRVPAVPTFDDSESYWGYTSAPPEHVKWWRELPSQ